MPSGIYKRKNSKTEPYEHLEYNGESVKLNVDRFIIMDDWNALRKAGRIIAKMLKDNYYYRKQLSTGGAVAI